MAIFGRRVFREKSEPKRKGGKGKKRSENNGRTGQTLRHQPAGAAPLFQGKTRERAANTPIWFSKVESNNLMRFFMQFFMKIAEFPRKFALKNSEEVYEVGVRFSLEIRKRVCKWFEAPRRLYSVEVPRELCGFCVFSRVFNSTFRVSFSRFYANL